MDERGQIVWHTRADRTAFNLDRGAVQGVRCPATGFVPEDAVFNNRFASR